MHRIFCMTISAFLFLLVIHVSPVSGQENLNQKKWTGSYSNGELITKKMLYFILLNHEKWLSGNGEKAYLSGADLRGADLAKTDLSRADLSRTNLSGAYLKYAYLREAILRDANLSGAYLRDADLSGARVERCNFTQTYFELKPNSLPYIPSFESAVGLSKLTYENSAHSLVELRESFRKAGLRRQEREITYAIKHTQRQKFME